MRSSDALIEATDWPSIRSATGSAVQVPGALRQLFAATTEEEATNAYWSHLDNEVVVQGALYEAAEHVIGPVLAELSSADLAAPASYRALELLVEIALGDVDEDQPDLALKGRCHAAMREGLWCLYGLTASAEERIAVDALHILDAVEEDRPRLASLAKRIAAGSALEGVRARAREIAS